MQSLIGSNTQSADTEAVVPVHAILRGGDAVIVAGVSNKPLFKFVTQKEITEPSQLRKKKDRPRQLRGTNEFTVTAALREWNIPRETVVPRRRGRKRRSFGGNGKKGLGRDGSALRSGVVGGQGGNADFGGSPHAGV